MECATVVQQALDAGYVHIDCAQFYENLPSVPKGIKLAGRKRSEVFIALKLGTFRGDREAFDGEVFLTNALKEVRGASSGRLLRPLRAGWEVLDGSSRPTTSIC